MIRDLNRGAEVRIDQTVADAYFLHKHPGWKPEDLGYPPRDFILISLMRLFE